MIEAVTEYFGALADNDPAAACVALVTRSIREIPSEVRIGREDGMQEDCAISLDNLRTLPKALLTERITQLGTERIDELCRALAAASGC